MLKAQGKDMTITGKGIFLSILGGSTEVKHTDPLHEKQGHPL